MNKQTSAATSIGLRVATAMYQMGIDGLPRNYELVYEAYSGTNPELTRDFVAIGKTKSQRALDGLGRKYLPHHHEETHVAKTNERMRTQMNTFMSLLEEEKSSLSDYGKIIDEASRTLASDAQVDRETMSRSIRQLSKATERQVSISETMVANASKQSAQLGSVKADIENFEQIKFVDPLTGLGNRRSFNKAAARIYSNPELPTICGLGFAEINNAGSFGDLDDKARGEHIIRHVGQLLLAAAEADDVVARLDGNRFAFLISSSDEAEIIRAIDRLRAAAGSTTFTHPKTGLKVGKPTLSVGVAMSTVAGGAGKLMAYGEEAMAVSTREGGDRVTFYSNSEHESARTGWMIYRP